MVKRDRHESRFWGILEGRVADHVVWEGGFRAIWERRHEHKNSDINDKILWCCLIHIAKCQPAGKNRPLLLFYHNHKTSMLSLSGRICCSMVSCLVFRLHKLFLVSSIWCTKRLSTDRDTWCKWALQDSFINIFHTLKLSYHSVNVKTLKHHIR